MPDPYLGIFVENRNKMKNILFLLFIFISVCSYAQKVGTYDKSVHATDSLETDADFIIARDTIVPILDVSYFEFSADGVTFSKDYTINDTWVRVSNYAKTSWDTIRVQPLLWELVGDSLKPIDSYLIAGDSIFGGEINTTLYKIGGDSLTHLNLPTGGGISGYILKNNGDGTSSWTPAPSGVGGAYGRNVGISGIGVYVDTIGSELQFKNIAAGGGITVSEADSTITVAWDGADAEVIAGVGISGGGDFSTGSITVNLYIPELIETSVVDPISDYAVIYDNSAAGHRKVKPYYFYPDVYIENTEDKANAGIIDFNAGAGVSVEGDGNGSVTYSADPIVLMIDGVPVVSRVDTMNFVAGTGVTIAYGSPNSITISTTPSGLPTCEEGQFLAYIGGEWTCVNVCDYLCADTIISIVNNYNDTVPSVITPSGDVQINFSRLDCEDSTEILASQLATSTLNLTTIKITSIPTVGELHYNGVAVIANQELTVALGSLDNALYYVSDASTGSAYIDGFNFQLLYSSNASYLGEANVNVSVDACVEESVCFGYLYNWYTVDDAREITSDDNWSVPTQSNIIGLRDYLTPTYGDGGAAKRTGFVFWASPNTGATNASGLAMIGSGVRSNTGIYSALSTSGSFWSSTSGSEALAWYASSSYNVATFSVVGLPRKYGRSIRLVKDATGLPDGTTTTYTGNDGKTYNAVVINELYWTTENLEETQYRNLDPIPNVTDNTTWANLTIGALCLYDNNNNNACKTPLPNIEQESISIGGSSGFLYSTYNTTRNRPQQWGQSITLTGAINKVEVNITNILGTPDCDYQAFIYDGEMTGSESSPSNTLLGASTNVISSSSLGITTNFFPFYFNNVSVSGIVSVVIKPVNVVTLNSSNRDQYRTVASDVYSGGRYLFTDGAIANWKTLDTHDLWLKVFTID